MKKPREPEDPVYLVVPREQARQEIDAQISKGKLLRLESLQIPEDAHSIFEELKGKFATWDEYNGELLRRLFTSTRYASEYKGGFSKAWDLFGEELPSEQLREKTDNSIRKLVSICERIKLISLESGLEGTGDSPKGSGQPDKRKVFVVHGHDEGARLAVTRFLEKLKLVPIILHEQANRGKTLPEKLEHNSDWYMRWFF